MNALCIGVVAVIKQDTIQYSSHYSNIIGANNS